MTLLGRLIRLYKFPKFRAFLPGSTIYRLMNIAPVIQQLGTEDGSLFKDAIQKLDAKDFLASIAVCDTLISRRNDHPESVALKALATCNVECLDETPPSLDEPKSIPLVKKSLRTLQGLKSPFCWHAAAQIHRMKREWSESVKCYKQAIKIEGGSLVGKKKEFNPTLHQLQREAAQVLTQEKSWSTLVKFRFDILVDRPSFKHNWISLALAYYFDGRLEAAGSIIDAVLFDFPKSPRKEDIRPEHIERFELFIFRLEKCLAPLGKYSEALTLMLEEEKEQERLLSSHFFKNMEPWLFIKANLFMSLSRVEEARSILMSLMVKDGGGESESGGVGGGATSSHLKLYLKTLSAKEERLLFLEDEIKKGRIPLSFLMEEKLFLTNSIEVLNGIISPMIKAGVPSIFEIIPPTLTPTLPIKPESLSQGLLKVRLLERDGKLNDALVLLDSLIPEFGATGDLLSLYQKIHPNLSLKTKISLVLVKMFPKDRSYVCSAVKNLLRLSSFKEAEELMLTFVRMPKLKHPSLIRLFKLADMQELQCIWYFKELSSSLLRDGDVQEALMYCNIMWQMYDDFSEDQYDFHNYIFRRSTISSYVEMVSFEPFNKDFVEIASIAIRCILAIKDGHVGGGLGTLSINDVDDHYEDDYHHHHDSDITKIEEGIEEEKEQEKEKIKALNLLKKKQVEREKIRNLKNYYLECEQKWIQPLLHRRSDLTETHQLAFDFYSSFGGVANILLAVKALLFINKLGGLCLIDDCNKIRKKLLSIDKEDPCYQVILEALKDIKAKEAPLSATPKEQTTTAESKELNLFLEELP